MNISAKTLIRAGALAGALAAIVGVFVGAVSFARPYMQSDDPPLASQQRVAQVSAQVYGLSQYQKQMQQQLMTEQKNQLFLTQGFWESQLSASQNELRIHPYNSAARQQMITAQQQLAGIQRQLYGGHQ